MLNFVLIATLFVYLIAKDFFGVNVAALVKGTVGKVWSMVKGLFSKKS